jgi:hypothetical protein
MSAYNTKHFSFTKNRKPIETSTVEESFPRWTHYLHGYEVPAETRRSKIIVERLARSNVLR